MFRLHCETSAFGPVVCNLERPGWARTRMSALRPLSQLLLPARYRRLPLVTKELQIIGSWWSIDDPPTSDWVRCREGRGAVLGPSVEKGLNNSTGKSLLQEFGGQQMDVDLCPPAPYARALPGLLADCDIYEASARALATNKVPMELRPRRYLYRHIERDWPVTSRDLSHRLTILVLKTVCYAGERILDPEPRCDGLTRRHFRSRCR